MSREQSTSILNGPSAAPDFKKVRSYLRTIQQRAALGRFIKAGWTPSELGEFARQVFLAPGRTYPTAASYQYAIEKGPEHAFAQEVLGMLRAPGFVMPAFNRPVLKRFSWDDPDSPDHSPETRAEIGEIARCYRNREASLLGLPFPLPIDSISRTLWRRCYRMRNKYHSLEDTLEAQGLREYR